MSEITGTLRAGFMVGSVIGITYIFKLQGPMHYAKEKENRTLFYASVYNAHTRKLKRTVGRPH